MCFLGRYFLLLWWRLHKGGNASIGAGASIFANLQQFGAGGSAAVANPQSSLGVTEGDIVAELVELVVTSLDKGETQMMNELHGDENTPRLADGANHPELACAYLNLLASKTHFFIFDCRHCHHAQHAMYPHVGERRVVSPALGG